MLSARRLIDPLREAPFRRLAAGRLLSYLGDWLVSAALVGWIYERTGSTAGVALLMIVRLLPLTIGSAVAASLADRFDRRRLLVATEVARVVAVCAVLACVATGAEHAVYAAVAVASLLAAIAGVTVRTLVPASISNVRLPAANANFAMAQETAVVLGALAAGIALSTAAASAGLAVAALAYATAVSLYLRVHVAPQAPVARKERSFRAGAAHLRDRPALLVLVASFAITTIATGLVNATLPSLLGGELGLGAGAYGFGLAALAGGLVVGEAVAGAAPLERAQSTAFGGALLLMACGFVGLGLAPTAALALTMLAATGIANGVAEVLFETLAQRSTEPAFYGRVFGFTSSLVRTTMMGAIAAAPLVDAVASPGNAVLVAACVLSGAGLVAILGDRKEVAVVHTQASWD